MTQKFFDLFFAILCIALSFQCYHSSVDIDISQIQGKPIGVGLPQFKPDEIDGLPTADLFFTKYVRPSKPLIMRGAAKVSPAFYKWSDEYFLSLDIPKGMTVEVEPRKKENRSLGHNTMSLDEFVNVYNTSELYLAHNLPSYLKGDLVIPCPLRCSGMKFETAILWFSSGGTSSAHHTDDVDNINCLFRGQKIILLIDKRYSQYHSLDRGHFSEVDIDAVDYEKYPGLAKVEYYNASISAGDCVYIPYLWAHQVRSYGNNLAVNLWWDNEVNDLIEPSQCASDCDVPVTYDEVAFSDENPATYKDVRKIIVSNFKSTDSMSIADTVMSLITHPALSEYVLLKTISLIKNQFKKTLQPIDANDDGILSVNEIMSANETNWNDMTQLANELWGYGDSSKEGIDEATLKDSDDMDATTEIIAGGNKDEL